jgi:hypothetical protein
MRAASNCSGGAAAHGGGGGLPCWSASGPSAVCEPPSCCCAQTCSSSSSSCSTAHASPAPSQAAPRPDGARILAAAATVIGQRPAVTCCCSEERSRSSSAAASAEPARVGGTEHSRLGRPKHRTHARASIDDAQAKEVTRASRHVRGRDHEQQVPMIALVEALCRTATHTRAARAPRQPAMVRRSASSRLVVVCGRVPAESPATGPPTRHGARVCRALAVRRAQAQGRTQPMSNSFEITPKSDLHDGCEFMRCSACARHDLMNSCHVRRQPRAGSCAWGPTHVFDISSCALDGSASSNASRTVAPSAVDALCSAPGPSPAPGPHSPPSSRKPALQHERTCHGVRRVRCLHSCRQVNHAVSSTMLHAGGAEPARATRGT